MINWTEIFWTSTVTIVGGVLIFCVSQIILKFYIESIQKLDECRGKICDILIFHRNVYLNPSTFSKEKEIEVSKKIREIASILLAKTTIVKNYNFLEKCNIVPCKKDILLAHKNLIGLSNSIPGNKKQDIQFIIKNNRQMEQEIKKALKISF
ncbi:MAG: hypothetical protein U9O91_03320 [Candidatus Caldatribacteriota bacterium]|nr:hypothetical protein [Candidatus Caldatribacteriota bacterium]